MSTTRRTLLKAAVSGAAAAAHLGAQQPKRPNILFLFPDQLRHDFIEPSTGVPIRTPNIKRLAEQGFWFTRAVTPAPLCAPARACLASGKEYDNCRVETNASNYPLDQQTVYQLLRSAGYHVMGCGKFDLHKPEDDWGLDGKRLIKEWGFSDGIDNEGKHDGTRAFRKHGKPRGPFLAYLQKMGMAEAHVKDYEDRKGHDKTFPTPLTDEAYGDNWITRNGIKLLDAAPKDKPWFLQVNFNGPHDPWDITASMEKGCRGRKFPAPNRSTEYTPETHQLIRQNYAAMIENIDRRVGELIEKVRQRGELDNTLIAFASDHGEMLGEFNLWGKRQPYHASAGVPLILTGLDVKKAQRSAAPATTLDLIGTFLDYAGVPVPKSMDTRSLRPVVTGKGASTRDHVLSGMEEWRLVSDGRYKYIRGMEAGPMLFDLDMDPLENNNLAKSRPDLVAKLSKALPKAR